MIARSSGTNFTRRIDLEVHSSTRMYHVQSFWNRTRIISALMWAVLLQPRTLSTADELQLP